MSYPGMCKLSFFQVLSTTKLNKTTNLPETCLVVSLKLTSSMPEDLRWKTRDEVYVVVWRKRMDVVRNCDSVLVLFASSLIH